MNFAGRRAQIRAGMEGRGLDLLIGVHDRAHFIEKPNPREGMPRLLVGGGVNMIPAARPWSAADRGDTVP